MGFVVSAVSFETVAVADVVAVFFVEFVVGDVFEALSPKYEGFFDREANALKE